MIDTKIIKERWNNFELDKSFDCTPTETHNLLCDLKSLADSHDDLERKLKIAVTALETISPHAMYVAVDALKQIRGE